MASKKVHILLESTIQQQHKEVITKKYQADYQIVNGTHYFRFDDEDTGKNTIKIDSQQHLTCLFEKHATKRLVFQEKEQTLMTYQLPQGMMLLTIQTKKLRLRYNAQGEIIGIQLHYTLSDEQTVFGKYTLNYFITH